MSCISNRFKPLYPKVHMQILFIGLHMFPMGGAVASWLVCSTPKRAVRVRALAGDIVLCSWARHSSPTVPLSTQVYKWVPANLMLGGTLRWTSIPSRGELKYSQSLHATETGIISGLMGHLARIQTLPYMYLPLHIWKQQVKREEFYMYTVSNVYSRCS